MDRLPQVNPNADTIEGLTAYASIADIPGEIERASIYLPPAVVLKVLDDIAAKVPQEVWLNPGSESDEVVTKARELGLNVIQACSIVDRGVTPAAYQAS